MMAKAYPVYKTEDWIAKGDLGFRFVTVENREFSNVEHGHDFYEISVLFHGGMLQRVNGKTYNQRPGDICILRPGDCHLLARQTETVKACVCSISAAVMDPFLTAFDIRSRMSASKYGVIFHAHTPQLQQLGQDFELLQCYTGQQKVDQGKIVISTLLQYYLRLENGEQIDWINRITREMNTPENLAKGISALQRIANLSRAQLCRVFRRMINQTPQEFVTELRLNYAHTMVCNTDEPFEKIAAMVGYASYAHFSDIFKKQFQQSPSALRKATKKYW